MNIMTRGIQKSLIEKNACAFTRHIVMYSISMYICAYSCTLFAIFRLSTTVNGYCCYRYKPHQFCNALQCQNKTSLRNITSLVFLSSVQIRRERFHVFEFNKIEKKQADKRSSVHYLFWDLKRVSSIPYTYSRAQ